MQHKLKKGKAFEFAVIYVDTVASHFEKKQQKEDLG